RIAEITRCHDHVVAFLHFCDQFGDNARNAVAVRTELDDDIAAHQRPGLKGPIAKARLLLDVNLVALLARPLDGAVGRAAMDDKKLVAPGTVDLRHDRFHAFELIQRHDDEGRLHHGPRLEGSDMFSCYGPRWQLLAQADVMRSKRALRSD